jgi:peptidyl-prolyl cis-trans isomerase SurA
MRIIDYKPKERNMKQTLLALLALSVCAALPLQAAEPLDRIVAVVNDEVIAESTLRQELNIFVAELRRQNPGVRLPPAGILAKQVLDRLILQRLQVQQAEQTGIRVDDNELNDTLVKVARQNGMRLSEFRAALAREGMSFADFRDNIREELTLQRLRQRQVANRVNVTPKEIDEFMNNQAKQGISQAAYHLMHILVSLPDEPTPAQFDKAKQRAQKILDMLNGGQDFSEVAMSMSDSSQALDGGDLGWREAAEIPSLFAPEVFNMKVGEVRGPLRNPSGFHIIKLADKRSAKAQWVTQTKARHILLKVTEVMSDAEAQRRLNNLWERLQGGDDFAQLASANSEDAGSATKGGDLGWVDPGSMVPEFEKVMAQLAPGEISQPFKTRFGWHIVQVLERRQHDNSEQAMRSQAAKQIRERKIEEELQSWLRQLREESYVEYRLTESQG